MPGRPLDRRLFLASLAACATAGPASAMVVQLSDPLSDLALPPPYVPPANMNAVMDMHSRMTAPVHVNGTGPYPFVVDTGSNQSVIADTLAAALALQHGPPELVNGIVGAESAPTTSATLTFGNRTETDVVLSILPRVAVGAVGMLGVDRLAGQRLTMNFVGARLSIEDARHARRDPDDIVMAAHPREGQLTLVDASLAGAPVIAFLNSGAERTIGNLALRDRVSQKRPALLWAEDSGRERHGADHRRSGRGPARAQNRRPAPAALAGRLCQPSHLRGVGGRGPAGADRRSRRSEPLCDCRARLPQKRSALPHVGKSGGLTARPTPTPGRAPARTSV